MTYSTKKYTENVRILKRTAPRYNVFIEHLEENYGKIRRYLYCYSALTLGEISVFSEDCISFCQEHAPKEVKRVAAITRVGTDEVIEMKNEVLHGKREN